MCISICNNNTHKHICMYLIVIHSADDRCLSCFLYCEQCCYQHADGTLLQCVHILLYTFVLGLLKHIIHLFLVFKKSLYYFPMVVHYFTYLTTVFKIIPSPQARQCLLLPVFWITALPPFWQGSIGISLWLGIAFPWCLVMSVK